MIIEKPPHPIEDFIALEHKKVQKKDLEDNLRQLKLREAAPVEKSLERMIKNDPEVMLNFSPSK